MRLKYLSLLVSLILSIPLFPQSAIRINQLGYQPHAIKVAVLMSENALIPNEFTIEDIFTGKTVFTSKAIKPTGSLGNFKETARLDFSKLTKEGTYRIITGDAISPNFRISDTIYNSTADYLLYYMRQQRCGYNPYLKDSCHTHDGFPVYSEDAPNPDSPQTSNLKPHTSNIIPDTSYLIPVLGGWHDASDYLQYVTTSATAAYQLMLAYKRNPQAFGDRFDKNGDPGANGIPDVLDEAKWGLDWLNRMYPGGEEMYQQIADDRDHQMFRLPTEDSVNYGKGLERPVYRVTGKPQGLMKYKNRSTGVASIAGKFASTMALGSELLQKYDPEFAATLHKKALEAYEFGKKYPGVSQTAPCKAPYFYEEDNWTDDMELAAAQLYSVTASKNYLDDAIRFGKMEEVTPWIGADTASHYQWFPFINLGHWLLAGSKTDSSDRFAEFYRLGLEKLYNRGVIDPFYIGVPYIWCSNNLVSAAMTQAKLYHELTKDQKYLEMEAALRDWLFGCNPWGTSMIVGLPKWGDYPVDPHSAFTHVYNYPVDGGLVDGPIYSTIFGKLIGIHLAEPDEYARFQPGRAVYHDDWGDYSTNEPTMDGTAGLAIYLSSLYKGLEGTTEHTESTEEDLNETAENAKEKSVESDQSVSSVFYSCSVFNSTYFLGALTRLDSTKENIALVFTGHEFADGYKTITETLKQHNIKANFFFTGDFYRNPEFAEIIKDLKNSGHYLGAHSDKHLLYNSWEKRDSTLVTRLQFDTDVIDNYKEMAKFGISKDDAPFFLPPFEWYNREIAAWTEGMGLKLINFTPGTKSNQDWTIPSGSYYYSSDSLYNSINNFESKSPSGLNGFLLLTHFGTHPERTDKFYFKLDELILYLKQKGYNFVAL
ncbi:MAG: glycoside hydrolase family 9 protein [Bacteroidetes bacterium]|nr:glycoside hydrolase family 9 protein [Bacteroidota bacterium]